MRHAMISVRAKTLHCAKLTKQSGMSLIEVLIAVLILSVGLLAMAGIHATSLKLTQINKYRLVATEVAQSLSESIKANSTAAIPVAPAVIGAYDRTAVNGANQAPNPSCDIPTSNCTPAQIAAVDMFNAVQAAQNLLPLGGIFSQSNPAIAATNNTTPTLSIWVYWASPRTTADATLATQLEATCPAAVAALIPPRTCVQFVVSL